MSVVITAPRYFSERAKGMLSLAGKVNAQLFAGESDMLAAMKDCVVLCVRVETKVTKAMVDAAPNLKVVLSGTTGTNHIDKSALEARNIPLFHLHGEHTRPTAEHSMGMLLGIARNIRPAHEALLAGEWDRHRFIGRELKGLKLGIVGLGKIGSETCRLATGFGMQVSAYDPYVPKEKMTEVGAEKVDSLQDLFSAMDAISLHCPLTDETRGMISAELLASLKDGSYVVNCARAGIVDDDALVKEIEKGRLCAAVDVFDPEPPGKEHILVKCASKHNTLILTPHLGASTEQAVERSSCKLAADALKHLKIEFKE
eukprot:m.338756 g.338756  ORF g.338756 m.338756 type:complete len:314 (+) comp18535_c0_seq1:138-1079(+)